MNIMSLAGQIWAIDLVILGVIAGILIVISGLTSIAGLVKISIQKVKETDLHG